MKRFLSIFTLLVMALVVFSFPAQAIDPPDSITIYSAKIVRNTAEDGDWSIAFHYGLNYADYPETAASETFIFRLYSADGSTLLSSTAPYVYFNYGYGQGAGSFYFDPDTVTALGLVWGTDYRIDIVGSPAFFDPMPTPYTYVLTSSDYSSVTSQEDNQEQMKSYILSVCRRLEAVYTDIQLQGSTDAGTVLTAIGESYFRGAIPGIASIAPTLFFTQFYIPESQDIDYDNTLAEGYEERLEDSDVMQGADAAGAKILGISGKELAAGFFFILAIAAVIFTNAKGWGVEPGLLVAGMLITCGSLLLGGPVATFGFVLAFVCGIIGLFILIAKRA